MNKRQIFKTIKSLEGFNKSVEHDSFEKSKKNADKPFQKYEFLGDRVLGLIISEYSQIVLTPSILILYSDNLLPNKSVFAAK